MLNTALQPVFQIDYLGSTDLHDVYHVVIYPELIDDLEAQAKYKQRATRCIAQAKANWRNVWVVVNLGYVTPTELVELAYRIGLPFMQEPLTIKAYNFEPLVVEDAATKSLDGLMRHTFKIEIMPSSVAALPPGFAEN